MSTPFVGWLLDERQRAELLGRLPPRYATPVAEHVTLKAMDPACATPAEVEARMVGHADDGEGVEAMVVAIDGTTARPDGMVWHITWSLARGRRARESNDVIARLGWTAFDAPIPIRLIPKSYG